MTGSLSLFPSQACDAFCVPEGHTSPELNSDGVQDGSVSECFDANGLQIADCQVRFCRDRFCATGELKYRGAVG
jgi:hypothetical protein